MALIDPAPGVPGPLRVDGALRVRGGAGGTRATLESLAAAAVRADLAAQSLASAAVRVRRAAAHPWPPGAGDAGRAASVALAEVDRGGTGLTACADRASALARALRSAVRTYEDADHEAWSRVAAVTIVVGGRLGDLGRLGQAIVGGGSWLAVLVGRDLLGLRALRASPGLAGFVLRALPDLSDLPGPVGRLGGFVTADGGLLPDGFGLPDAGTVELGVLGLAAFWGGQLPGPWTPTSRPVERIAGTIGVLSSGVARLMGMPQRALVVAPLVGGGAGDRDGREERAPQGVGDVVRQVAELGDERGPTVGVQRLDHADGTRSWVVSVPGTRSMDLLGGENPMDNGTNLALMAGRPDDMTAAVEAAMLRAGVGPDEPVLLAGHSQGGMVVTRLAASLQGTFAVEAVVTAGSPVGSMPVPDGVAALHLEHAQDYVPALDGRPNPDAANRTTVVRTLPGSPATVAGGTAGLAPADLLPAHEAWTYAGTAALVDRMDDPSVRGFRQAAAGVLGDGSAHVTTQTYVVARLPEQGPDPARAKPGGG